MGAGARPPSSCVKGSEVPHRRLTRLLGAVAVLIVLAPLAAGGSATAASSHRPIGPNSHAKIAEQALAAVQAAFAHVPPTGAPPSRTDAAGSAGEITLALRDLRANLGALSGADRRAAEGYLARPTDSSEPFGASYARAAKPTSDCALKPNLAAVANSHFCIHYARSGGDAPPLADKNPHNGIPDQVDRTRTVMDHVWDMIVDQGGYHPPPPDGKKGGQVNGQSRFDVYLSDIGDQGLYGYCAPETAKTTAFSDHAATSYCVLDDDYREFPRHTHLQNLQVTGAHEFFHSVQFAYDYTDDTYFLENTATWVEDQIYTKINDNRQFLIDSSQRNPGRPLDASSARYGNWIWWRYLTERFPDKGSTDLPLLVRNAWDNAITLDSLNALAITLDDLGTSIPEQLGGFGVASRHPSAPAPIGFSEGSAYTAAPVNGTANFGSPPSTTGTLSLTLNHLANGTVRFVPNAAYGSTWQLKVDVGTPSSPLIPFAMLTVVPKSGAPTKQAIPLAGNGAGTATVSFNSATVKQVELTLTNGNQAGSPAVFSFKATSLNSAS